MQGEESMTRCAGSISKIIVVIGLTASLGCVSTGTYDEVEAQRNAPRVLKWREECKDWFATEDVRRIATPVYPPEDKWRKRPPVD